jgi:hypothetical protein
LDPKFKQSGEAPTRSGQISKRGSLSGPLGARRSRLEHRPATRPAGAPKNTRKAAGIWSTNELMRDAELELARQAETSYQRLVQDQLAGRAARKVGASATPERA